MKQCTERLFPHASGGTFPASLLGKKALEGFRKVDLPSILNQMTGGKGMRVIIPLYLRAQINKKLSNTTFMSLSKFESEVKFIPQPNVYVYSRFADLSNLGAIKERLADPEVSQDEVHPGDEGRQPADEGPLHRHLVRRLHYRQGGECRHL